MDNEKLPPLSVSSALPVGVWRTYQTPADLPVREEPLASPEQSAPPGWNRGVLLSACMIVRNEERHLPACLEALKPLVDEIVIVDTGSQDRTKDIARSYQARLFDFPWSDSFAAARNEALSHARGEWILQIDADEIVQPFPRARLRQLLAAEDICGYYILLRRHPGLTPNWQMKVFRNHRQLRHTAVIHEAIIPQRVRAATGGSTGCFPMLVEHSGYTGDQSRKNARNLPLLLRLLRDEPDHSDKAFIWAHVADIQEAMGNHELAIDARVRSLTVLAAKGCVHPADCALYLAHLTGLVERGQDASPLFDRVTQLFPGNLQLSWIRGHWLIQRGQFPEAAACFQHILDRGIDHGLGHWVGYDQRLFGALSQRALALCASA